MHRSPLSILVLPLLLVPVSAAASLSCENVRIDGHSFDLSKLGGPHSVVTSRWEPSPPEFFNTTYTLDICKPLKKSDGSKKGSECPNGTRGGHFPYQRVVAARGDTDLVTDVVAIAGSLEHHGGSQFDYEATRLSTSDSNSDSKKEGLRLVLKGGKHLGREQKAIVEFLCDHKKTGTEGEWDAEDKNDKGSKLRVREDDDNKDGDKDKDEDKDKDDGDNKDEDKDKEGDKDKDDDDNKDKDGDGDDGKSYDEHQLKKEDASLIWESYGAEKDADILRLTWYTQYACEKRDGSEEDDGNTDVSAHWGFFTWFVIVLFLGIATYLIFGSWLNYNRYGARGWDLLPHGDTIRDVPYLMKDWLRRVLNTVQGTGSRGGYSAV
ncbi:hypothetical protein G7046_g8968 [Stylonectria norvegica]|nr:hypothetical protein G7046_g8968 [Stylonectria norvegica]